MPNLSSLWQRLKLSRMILRMQREAETDPDWLGNVVDNFSPPDDFHSTADGAIDNPNHHDWIGRAGPDGIDMPATGTLPPAPEATPRQASGLNVREIDGDDWAATGRFSNGDQEVPLAGTVASRGTVASHGTIASFGTLSPLHWDVIPAPPPHWDILPDTPMPLTLGPSHSRPQAARRGQVYYDTEQAKVYIWTGTLWEQIAQSPATPGFEIHTEEPKDTEPPPLKRKFDL